MRWACPALESVLPDTMTQLTLAVLAELFEPHRVRGIHRDQLIRFLGENVSNGPRRVHWECVTGDLFGVSASSATLPPQTESVLHPPSPLVSTGCPAITLSDIRFEVQRDHSPSSTTGSSPARS